MSHAPDTEGSGFQRQPSRKLSHTGTSLYEVLTIDKGASPDDVRKAYRKLALRNHPDKNPNDPHAAERFKEINHAHSVLSDVNKRSIYDQYGSVGIQLMDRIGQDNLRLYMALNSPCVKGLLIFCFCITGCCCCLCCCCCCNFCCGKCAPEANNTEDFYAQEDEVVTTQPTSAKESTPLSSNQPPAYSE